MGSGEFAVNRLGGTQKEPNPLRLNIARVHVPLSAVLAAWAGRKIGAALGWLLRHPLVFGPVVALWLGLRLLDGAGTTAAMSVVLTLTAVPVVLVVWRLAWPESFTRLVAWRVRGWSRGFWVYRYYWQPAMLTTNLSVRAGGKENLPRLLGARSTRTVDRVLVRMLPGQTVEDYAMVSDRLAQTFGVEVCRVRTVPKRRHQVELWLLVHDPLDQTVAPFPPDPDCLTKGDSGGAG